jgi:hypothetical protein
MTLLRAAASGAPVSLEAISFSGNGRSMTPCTRAVPSGSVLRGLWSVRLGRQVSPGNLRVGDNFVD